ncbi:major capsid protein [Gordonia phage Trine]|uniref:Major capsid protein n=1 Tax=Gordonia phage Trine TaxID=2201431 RepID=A0A2Z4Q8V7_9CAUD|nr:major capsid protein [Gordonia phage Trine]AWY06507.1 major capsid protein [Gordonia phage Trine]
MATLKEQRAELLKQANAIADQAKAAGRGLTAEEQETLTKLVEQVKGIDADMARIDKDAEIKSALESLGGMTEVRGDGGDGNAKDSKEPVAAKSLGEHFIKSVGDRVSMLGVRGGKLSAEEFKAPATQTTAWTEGVPLLTEYDRTIVQPTRKERPTIADLCGSGTISGQAISYFVEAGMEGGFGMVAEGAAKPQISFANPTAKVDALKKIAGWIDMTDEFIEDLPFLKSEIDTRLMYQLQMYEESQLLRGDGTGQNLLGLANRSGVQVQAAPDSPEDNADAVFQAMTKVSTATALTADALVIHPLDYQNFRLSKDGNGQYFGGGYFQGEYGNGTIMSNPNLWGLRTVVTTAANQGEIILGAFRIGATVYRKGGVRVDATNTHADNFTNNKVTIRAEERIALAVRYPAAFVKVSLAAPEPVEG